MLDGRTLAGPRHRSWGPWWPWLLLSGLVLLRNCGPVSSQPPHPLETRVFGHAQEPVAVRFQASTNCAEPGTPVVLTATVTNEGPEPLVLRGRPPVDIVITHRHGTAATQRWSAQPTTVVPAEIVLTPQVPYVVEWVWLADPAFGAPHDHTSGASIQATWSPGWNTPYTDPMTQRLVVGVGVQPEIGSWGMACSALGR